MSISPLELFFARLRDNIEQRLKGFTPDEKLADITRFLDERSITTITAQELYDKLVRTPEGLVKDYANILSELIKDNLEEIESVVALETSITALKGVMDNIKAKTDNLDAASSTLGTHAKQTLIETAVDAVKDATDLVKGVLDDVKTGTDKIIASGATEAKQDNIITQVDLIAVGTDKIVASGAIESKQDTIISQQKKAWAIEPSESLLLSNDSEVYYIYGGGGENKEKEIAILRDGMYRIKYDGREGGGNGRVKLKIDGVQFIEQAVTTSWVTYTHELALGAGDLLSLWLHNTAGEWTRAKNWRLYGDETGLIGMNTLEDGSP